MKRKADLQKLFGVIAVSNGLRPAASIWFENRGSQVLKVQQKEVRSTGLRVLSPEFFI